MAVEREVYICLFIKMNKLYTYINICKVEMFVPHKK